MPNSHVNCQVFVDFDGTIAPGDATDMLFDKYADPSWLDVEADWKAGRIGSRECMARQVDLLRATPEQYNELISEVRIDPAFPAFVELCRAHGIAMTVVSDGLDRTISKVMQQSGLDLPFYANRLEWLGGDRWRLAFPNSREDCATLSGNCKCQFTDQARGKAPIMIGDGRSDFCISGRVDMVLAKGALAEHCRAKGLPHHKVAGFADVNALFAGWLRNGQFLCNGQGLECTGVAK